MEIRFGEIDLTVENPEIRWITEYEPVDTAFNFMVPDDISFDITFDGKFSEVIKSLPTVLSINDEALGELTNIEVNGNIVTADFAEYQREE